MNELIFEQTKLNLENLNTIDIPQLNNYPIVYILYNDQKRPSAYIGQTVQLIQRFKNHREDSKKKNLSLSILIGHQKFNQSATYNIETNLINYFIADNHYELQNVSQTKSRIMHNYYQKSFYDQQLFRLIWEKLRNENIVRDTIENLTNKDTYKLSPYKELSSQQAQIKEEILDFCQRNINSHGKHVIVIEGDAGTGKSVLLSSLFNTIQDLVKDSNSPIHETNNYLVVNHAEMLKTYKNISRSLPNLKKKSFMKPTSFINEKIKTQYLADIVLIDEAHLLLTKEDTYNNFHAQNQLEEIIKLSKITVVIFDSKQVLKIKSYWNEELLREIIAPYHTKTVKLTNQMRMNATQNIINWINHFVSKKILPLPPVSDSSFELEIFDDPQNLKTAIQNKDNEFSLSRTVSTFDYLHKKDGAIYMVDEKGLNMPWNSTQDNITWAELPHSVNEVGSIYTVQGFDLNYVGVLLGPSVSYDEEKDELIIKTSEYKDKGAFTSRADYSFEKVETIKEEIILNSINILMKRGIYGLYIYATDPKLRKRLIELKRSRAL